MPMIMASRPPSDFPASRGPDITERRDRPSCDAVTDRPGRRVRANAGIDLAIDVADVALDGVDRDAQACGDLAVRLAIGQEAQDLGLAWGERSRGGLPVSARPCSARDRVARRSRQRVTR